MNATDIGPLEDALLVLLRADPTLAAIEGPPQLGPPANPMPRHVWISAGVNAVDRVELSDGSERVETFDLELVCFAATTGSSFTEARDRSAVLATAAADVIDANYHLSFSVGIVDVHVTGVTRDYAAWDKTQGIVHAVRVSCEAVLA